MTLQVAETTGAIKDLANIKEVTSYGLMFLVIVGLIVFIIHLIKKEEKRADEERKDKDEMVKVLNDIANNLNTRNQVLVDVKASVEGVRDDTKEVLIYIRQK